MQPTCPVLLPIQTSTCHLFCFFLSQLSLFHCVFCCYYHLWRIKLIMSGYPSAEGRACHRESSPTKTDVLAIVPARHQRRGDINIYTLKTNFLTFIVFTLFLFFLYDRQLGLKGLHLRPLLLRGGEEMEVEERGGSAKMIYAPGLQKLSRCHCLLLINKFDLIVYTLQDFLLMEPKIQAVDGFQVLNKIKENIEMMLRRKVTAVKVSA